MILFERLEIQGFGVIGEADVRLDSRGLTLIQGDNRDTAAAVSNGAGKSTIFKAISWALFGQTIDGLKTDVINKAAKKAAVQVTLRIDGLTYVINRERTKSKLTLGFWTNRSGSLEDLSQVKTADTQKSIEDLIGLDFDAFRCVVLFGQGDNARFASPTVTDSARKAILQRVLALDKFEAARTQARDDRAGFEVNRGRFEKDKHKIERDNDALNLALDMRGFDLEDAIELLDAGEAKQDDALDRLVNAREAEAEAVESQAAFLRVFGKVASPALGSLDLIAELKSEVENDRKAKRSKGEEVYRLKAKLKACGGEACPTCGNVTEEPDKKTEATTKKLLRSALSDFDIIQENLSENEAEIRKLERANEAIERAHEDQIKENDRNVRSAEKFTAEVERNSREVMTEVAGVSSKIDKLKTEITQFEKKIKICESNLKKVDAKIYGVNETIAVLDWWVKAFGPKGVQAYAIEQALPALNAHTNRHLTVLSDGDLSVRWTATTPTKAGGEKEELTCNVTVEGLDDVPPSGGQWRKIELATEIALAEVVKETGGAASNILLLDEALDGLDEEGTARVCEWLEGLDYESIFVISHSESISDSFESIITITKRDKVATIKDS